MKFNSPGHNLKLLSKKKHLIFVHTTEQNRSSDKKKLRQIFFHIIDHMIA